MNKWTDQQLLRDYADHRSEGAFAELVRRHIDFVYSAALRMVGNADLAKDVSQNTFLALAQAAPKLVDRPVLSGWLHRSAQNLAAKVVRSDVRRHRREQEAAAMNQLLSAEPEAAWEHIVPHLDAALGELSEPDRDAVLLRYVERKSAQEMAASLGISADAAQKRVSRAVERLREFFAKRGVTIGAGGLVVVISANAVQAAPMGLAVTISTAAVLAGTTLATTATATATKAIVMTTLQKTIFTATVAILAGAGIYEAHQAARLRDQVQTLQQQQPSPLPEQLQQLTRERDDATRLLAALRDENTRLSRETTELLKLRGEVGVSLQQANEAKQNLATALSYEAKFTKDESAATDAMKHLSLAMLQWALDQNDMFPTNVLQLTNELATSFTKLGNSFARNGVNLSGFDFVNAGSVTRDHAKMVMLRERFARQASDGTWRRIYGFADGRVITAISVDGNFDAWEKANTDSPLPKQNQ